MKVEKKICTDHSSNLTGQERVVKVVSDSSYLVSSDEFELKFPEPSRAKLKSFRAESTVEPSWGTSIFELKPKCHFLYPAFLA